MKICAPKLLLGLALSVYAHAQTTPLTGTIHVWGSPQMRDLLHQFEAGFHAVEPGVTFDEELKSTITAVAGVYTDRAQIGLLGRGMWPVEGEAFRSVKGYAPTVLEVATGAYDVPKAAFALMVFVPRGNPVGELSVGQLERVFGNSKTPVHTWGELGLTGAWAARPVHPYGFSVENDKSQIFAQMVFSAGERWTPSLHEFPPELGPHGEDAGELIVQAVAGDPDAIGISNVHYQSPAVKALAIRPAGGGAAVVPSRASVAARDYPLSRAVYLVVDRAPDAATLAFLRFVFSAAGQQAVVREGNYLPLPPATVAAARKLLKR